MKKALFALTLLSLPLCSVLRVDAAVDASVVSADARWLVYADLNALRQSAVGKELLTLGEKAKLDTEAGQVGIDWQKLLATIGSATAYGTNLSPDPSQIDGTLIVRGGPDLKKIAESLLIQANLANPKEVAELTDLPFPAYVIKENRRPAKPAAKDAQDGAETKAPAPKRGRPSEPLEVIIAFPKEPVVIVSKSKAQIIKAGEVVRGASPSLAKTASSPLAKFLKSSDDAYLFTASTVPTDGLVPEEGPQARILKMANSGAIAIGGRGDNIFAHSDLVASSDQMAEKLMKILQGITAMLSLAETNDKALADFLNSAKVDREGKTVTLDLSYSEARMATMIKNLQQKNGPSNSTPPMLNGRSLAEWQAEAGPTPVEGTPAPIVSRTLPGITLKSGTTLTLARATNGGRNIRYNRVEITPADGAGAAMTFTTEFMRTAGPRGNWQQFQFPGADGSYTLKVFYVNDPEGKATFAVSAKDPRPAVEPETKTK